MGANLWTQVTNKKSLFEDSAPGESISTGLDRNDQRKAKNGAEKKIRFIKIERNCDATIYL